MVIVSYPMTAHKKSVTYFVHRLALGSAHRMHVQTCWFVLVRNTSCRLTGREGIAA